MQLHFYLLLYCVYTPQTLTVLYCAAFGCKGDSARYRELSFFRFPLKKRQSSLFFKVFNVGDVMRYSGREIHVSTAPGAPYWAN